MSSIIRTLSPAAIAAAALVALAAPAEAGRRPYAPRMSCDALQGMIADRGAVVLSTSPTTYDRFVSDRRFCQRTENTRPAWIESADAPDCFIGYTCQERSRDDKF